MKFDVIYGVDFSGAKLAGRNIWVAEVVPIAPPAPRLPCFPFRGGPKGRVFEVANGRGARKVAPRDLPTCDRLSLTTGPHLRLVSLASLESLCGTAERRPALQHLVAMIERSAGALWSMDFPFGFPLEVLPDRCRWPGQLAFLREWGEDAYGVGLECLRRAKSRGGPMHIRRLTDHEMKAPFDCYHYRIIYQSFYGMRDVLGPLWRSPGTAIVPFQYRRLPGARRVLVETCPSSTLKRLALPHQNYKQPAGGPLTPKRRRTRHAILAGLSRHVEIDDRHRRVMMRNGGGDAIDAVIAAVGGLDAWRAADHAAVARHARYPREGRLFA